MAGRHNGIASKLPPAGRVGWREYLGSLSAAQLLEFAFILPFLVVLTVGIFDFGAAFRLRQKLTNAAREGARIAAGLSTIDLSTTSCPATGRSGPCTVGAVRDAVVNYLASEGLATAFIDINPTQTGPLEWTYFSTTTSNPILVIDRGFAVTEPVTGTLLVSTRVALSYPYGWTFDRIVRLLVPSTSLPSSFTISTEAIMKNL